MCVEDPADRERERVRPQHSAEDSEMKISAWVCCSCSLLTVIHVSVGEMYTSLLNIQQAMSVERKLIDSLRTYIDQELERLEDIKR